VDADANAESSFNYTTNFTYTAVRNALINADSADPALSAAVHALPTIDPTGGETWAISTAEQKALGLRAANASGIDGWVGLNSSTSFTFDPDNRAVSGEVDAIGAIEHEVSEILGRSIFAGEISGAKRLVGPLDLFRYSSAYTHTFQPGASYFSLDNGLTNLKAFNNSAINSGDAGDWASSTQTDSFDAFGRAGIENDVSAVDVRVMELLGYSLLPTSLLSGGPTVGPGIGGTPQLAPAAGGTVNGGSGSDWLLGQGGADILHGGGGSDYLDGAGGVNTALYDGVLRQYTVGAGGATVAGGPEGGTDVLVNIQRVQFVDGYMAYSPTDTAGQVYRLYEATLNRAPDQDGLATWVHSLNGGTSLQTAAGDFVASQEFQSTYGSLNNNDFVTLLYSNVLHRAPDSAGLTSWVNLLNSGQDSRAQVVLGFSESSENVTDLAAPVQQGLWIEDTAAAEAARLYDTVFGRLPDTAGLITWTHSLESGTSLQTAAADFVASQEFQSTYGNLSDTDFVTLLYNNVLHRPPDSAGLNTWLGGLSSGQDSRAQVVLDFSESQEHITDTAAHIAYGVWTT
jgi:hypothetical protein